MPSDDSASTALGEHTKALLIQEYASLREELAKRIELRQRIVEITIISFGAIVALPVSDSDRNRILLAFPFLAMLLASQWVHQGIFMQNLGSYLHNVVEPILSKGQPAEGGEYRIGYELETTRAKQKFQDFFGTASASALFIILPVGSVTLGIYQSEWSRVDWVLLVAGVTPIILSVFILLSPRILSRRRLKIKSQNNPVSK